MSDKKKKKKSKQKQNQNQRQTQQVIVNVGARVRRRRAEPGREVRENKLNISAQPPPIVQYVYRDNLALNSINDRMRENAITQTLMKTAQQLASQTQQVQQQAPKLATPSPALYQQQPATPAPTKAQQPTTAPPPMPPLSFSVVKDILEKSKLFNKTNIPNENTNKFNKVSEFDKVVKPPPPPQEKLKLFDDTDFEDDNIPVRAPFKKTKDGLPFKRSKDYGFWVENYIGKIPPEQRNKKQQQAYEEYMNTLSKPSGNDEEETVEIPRPPLNSASVQPVDNVDDDEEEFFLSPLKRKPT